MGEDILGRQNKQMWLLFSTLPFNVSKDLLAIKYRITKTTLLKKYLVQKACVSLFQLIMTDIIRKLSYFPKLGPWQWYLYYVPLDVWTKMTN